MQNTKRNYQLLWISVLVILFFSAFTTYATISLPSLFSSGVVLQQNTNANIWGWAGVSETISIKPSWDNQTYAVTADGTGYWKAKLTTPVGGSNSYSITFTDSKNNNTTLSNVLIGEVWICSGQSNMNLAVSYDANAATVPNDADYPNIRIFSVPRKASMIIQKDVTSSWISPTSQTVLANFSAIPFFFARNLYKYLNVPIGILHTAYGSSSQEAWLSEPNVSGLPHCDKLLSDTRTGNPPIEQNIPTGLYNAMFKPLVPFTVKGVCWYQGESNILYPDEYVTLSSNFINSWRTELEQPNLPFLITQLAGYNATYAGDGWPRVQETQYKLSQKFSNVATILTYDIGDSTNIHPTNKQDVALRHFLAAKKMVYGENNLLAQGPSVINKTINGNKVGLKYKDVGTGLVIKSGYSKINNFMLAGADKTYYSADATIIGPDSIELTCSNVSSPKYIRYAYKPYASFVNLYNSVGLPAVPFRTDSAMNFVSTQSGNWSDIGTWGGLGVPYIDDNVTIASGHVVSNYISSASSVTKGLCKNLTVDGTLQMSNSQSANFYVNVYGPIICNGTISSGINSTGVFLNFQSNAGLSGAGTATFGGLNLQASSTDCLINLPIVNIKSTLTISASGSRIIVAPGTTISLVSSYPNLSLSPSSSAGQAGNNATYNIYGTVNVSKVYLCNNFTGTIKGAVNVKAGGILNVSTALTPVRGAGSVSGTIGGSGCVLSVENGGKLNFPVSGDPVPFTVPTNTVYDPKLEIVYYQGSIINGITKVSNEITVVNSTVLSNKAYYDYKANKLILFQTYKNLKVYTSIGNQVFNSNNPNQAIQFPSNLKGLYIVKLTDYSNKYETLKIIFK